MTSKAVAIAFVILCSLVVACETSKPERASAGSPSSDSSAMSDSETQRLVARAEAARDREFDEPPAIEHVSAAEELPEAASSPQPVRDERQLILAQLFGVEPAAEVVDRPRRPFDAIARYDADGHRVVYLDTHPDGELVELAIIARLVEALDHQHFEALPAADTWDDEFALEAARHATIGFALAANLVERGEHDVSPDQLAKRPELAGRLPGLGEQLQPSGAGDQPAQKVGDRLRTAVLREGWTLGAALYRSSGWSGVELARLTPPERSADVVRPDQWMSGEPVGDWTWPSEGEGEDGQPDAEAAGTIGPALTAIWLEETVGPQAARSIYGGYISDAYRHFPGDESPDTQQSARFEWLSLWNSPDNAQQVARAVELRLRKRFEDADDPESRFVVFQKGLKVGVILAEMPADEMRERARQVLDAHKVQLMPREGLPTSFVKTRQDELAEQMQAAELEERVWRDPATNLRLDLNELGDAWTVRQPDSGPVRWFARHDEDGSLLQLTVELDDPLGAEFGTDAYREQLTEAFSQSITDVELQQMPQVDMLPEPNLALRINGKLDGQPRTLQMWQFKTDDLVVTYSLQTPPEHFEEHRSTAATILEEAQPLENADEPAAEQSGSGTIEYEVEDE